MNKILSLLLIFSCICCLFGCQEAPEVPDNAVTVYYKRAAFTYGTEDSVIAPSYIVPANPENDLTNLLKEYLTAVPADGFVSPFPLGLSIVSFEVDALTAKIVLTDRIALLSGIDLILACSCLTQTIMGLTDCHEVIISAESKLLDGEKFITLNQNSYLLLDKSATE